MVSTTKNIRQLHSHTAALQTAIANLEKFASKNESAPIAHIANLTVREGQLVDNMQSQFQQTITLARCFFFSKAREHQVVKKSEVQDILLNAIDVIKKNHLLIEQLQKGSLDEQKLAVSAIAAIKRYNAVIEKSNARAEWHLNIARFFYKLGGYSLDEDLKSNRIDLPRQYSINYEVSKSNPKLNIGYAFKNYICDTIFDERTPEFSAVMLTKMMADPLSKQEIDLLRMKANTLLKQNGIRFRSMAEGLQVIKEAPIHTTFDENSSIASLRLSLTLIPGTVVELQGAFQRNSQEQNHSIPIPERFRLVFRSLNNGYPHPLQYAGWGLGNALIPSYPHRLDQMHLFQPLYTRKQEAAKALLPNGVYFDKAKEIGELKSQVYKKNKEALLKLHQDLSFAIIKAAPCNSIPENAEETIFNFFEQLANHPTPIDYIARTYQAINEHFIERQHLKLQDIWMGRNENNIMNLAQKARKDLAEDNNLILRLFDEERQLSLDIYNHRALEFAKCLGSILQIPVQSILLQHHSENFGFPPRMLTDFEQKIQAASYKQLLNYLDEIEGKIQIDSPFDYVKSLIESDIAFFNTDASDLSDSPYMALTHELEIYFNSRYYSSL